jgi:hypothetical protein
MVRISRTWLVQIAVAAAVVGGFGAAAVVVSKVAHPAVYTLPGNSGGAGRAVPIAGTDVSQVTLSADAVKRVGVQTNPIGTVQAAGKPRLTIPYGAVLYDESGKTWAYVTTDQVSFVRKEITIESIQNGTAILLGGPPAGTQVVTVGAAELYGTETGVGQE